MLLTFTTFAIADEGRYTMVKSSNDSIGGVWILDSEKGKLKYCWWAYKDNKTDCNKWRDLDYNED